MTLRISIYNKRTNPPVDLPPEIQEVEDELRETFKRGGLEACKTLVNRLATEAEFGEIVSNESDHAWLKLEEDTDTFPEIRLQAAAHIRELKVPR